MPKITAIFIALHVLLLLSLAYRVVAMRRVHKLGLGDGSLEPVQQRIRAHANATEYVPVALLELLALELLGVPALWLYAAGGTLFVGRLLHAMGLASASGYSFGRFYGTLLTWLTMLAMAIALLFHALH
ncbi:MAG: MAPEG family protein [Lysobacterales bacterium]